MLFRRRIGPDWWEWLRVLLWPRRSFWRSGQYFVKRTLRLTGSPHAIAAGIAAGVFASITPFVGFHFIFAFVIAFFIGGNLIAAALGTAFGNPLSFPFIWASTFNLGSLILRTDNGLPPVKLLAKGPSSYSLNGLGDYVENIVPIIKPMIVGAIPIGVVLSICAYFLTRWAVRAYQSARREKLERSARRRIGSKHAFAGAEVMGSDDDRKAQ